MTSKLGKKKEKERIAAVAMLLGAEWSEFLGMFVKYVEPGSGQKYPRYFTRTGEEVIDYSRVKKLFKKTSKASNCTYHSAILSLMGHDRSSQAISHLWSKDA